MTELEIAEFLKQVPGFAALPDEGLALAAQGVKEAMEEFAKAYDDFPMDTLNPDTWIFSDEPRDGKGRFGFLIYQTSTLLYLVHRCPDVLLRVLGDCPPACRPSIRRVLREYRPDLL